MSRIEELERRVRQDPASITFGALAEEYRRSGRLDDAVAACRTGLERHPSYLSARVTLGRALQQLGQPDDARAEFEYVLSLAPDNLAAIRGMAEMHVIPGSVRAAIREEPRTDVAESSSLREPDLEMRSGLAGNDPDFDALDASIAEAAMSADGGATEAQRAAQIERLEIWLARLDDLRRAGSHDA